MDPQEPIVKDPKVSRANLYKGLVEKKLFSKSFEEFETQFSNEDSRYRLFNGLVDKKLLSKNYDDFDAQFFGDLKKKEFTDVGPQERDYGSPESFATQPLVSPEQQIVSSPIPESGGFDDELDKENALKELEIKRQNEILRQQYPDFVNAIQETPSIQKEFDPERIRHEQQKKIADESLLRQNLGVDEKPISLFERSGSIAGSFNKPIIDVVTSIPKAAAIVRKGIGELMGDSKPIQAYDSYKLGQWLDEKALEAGITATNPKLQDSFLQSTIPQALGSAFSFMMTGGISGGSAQLGEQITQATVGQMAKKGAQELGQLMASRTAATGGVVMGIQEFEQAKRAGLSDEDAFTVFAKNYGIGMTEVVPIARALERINKFSGGTISQILAAGAVGSLEEGTQEGVQQYLTNKVAQGSYDPTREPFADMIESVGAGMFVGFVLPGIMGAVMNMEPSQREQTLNIINAELKKQAAKGPKIEPKVKVDEKPSEPVAPAGEQKGQPAEVSKVEPQEVVPVQTKQKEPAAATEDIKSTSPDDKKLEKIHDEFGNIGLTYADNPIDELIDKTNDWLIRPDNGKYDEEKRKPFEERIKKLEDIKKQGFKTLSEWAGQEPSAGSQEPVVKPKDIVDRIASTDPKEVAKQRLQSLVDSGDLKKEGSKYTVLTEKGGKELKDVMESLKPSTPPTASKPEQQVTDRIKEAIGTEKLDKRSIEKIGEEAGITDKNQVKELAELAVVQRARELAKKDDFEGLVQLYEDQPNLTHRTNESIEKQQYSTPAPIAYLAGKYTHADKVDKKLEPSAGNGMLTIVGDPKDYTVNEIDDVRRGNLETQGFGEVLNQDGSQDFARPKQYDAVITNPPFGGTEATDIEGYKFNELSQIMSTRALDAMKDTGRASIIIGGNNSFDDQGRLKGRDRIYFNYLFNKYNVEDVVDIAGEIYRKQGASFPIRLILINGRKAKSEGVAPTKEWFGEKVSDFNGIRDRVQKFISDENLQPTELERGPADVVDRGGAGVSGQVEQQQAPAVPGKPVQETGGQVPDVKPGKVRSGDAGTTRTGQQPGGSRGSNLNEQSLSEESEQQRPAELGEQQQPEAIEGTVPEQRPKRDRKVAAGNESGESTVDYKPVSKGKSFNVNTPANLQQEILDAQTQLENEVGDVDEFVRGKLGYKSNEEMYKALGAEQIDAVALAIRNIERGTAIIIGDQPGIGKGRSQPLESKILTPTGWVSMGEIKLGQSVISGDGTPTKVIGVYPQGELDVFEITFSDGSKTQCSEDHLWLTINNDQKVYLKSNPDKYKVYAQWRVKTTGELLKKVHQRFSIPIVSPITFKKQITSIDPYLLGVLIGDASLRHHAVELTCADDQILSFVSELIDTKLQVRFTRKYHYQIGRKSKFGTDQSNPLIDALRKLSLAGKTAKDKFIPESYKFNDIESRVSLLQGLMDTDGYVSADGNCMYYTVSKQLADDVQFIVQSLGGIATRGIKKPTYTYKGEKKKGLDCHVIYIKMPNDIIPFRLQRKKDRCVKLTKYQPNRIIKSIKKIGKKECQCIKVDHPSSLYVTDDFIVTHNTGAALVRYANQQGKRPIFLTKAAYLFSAFYGDLTDIGYGQIKPFIFNSRDATKFPSIVDANGKTLFPAPTAKIDKRPIPDDAKLILATYSQFSSPKYADKIDLFRELAKDNIIIMDESHMASGDDSNTTQIFQEVLPTTKGVVYLSGTYAKRASNMPVYAMKTSMREANMEPQELVEAIMKGGNPLQEINASILTEAGEMIRRERTFKGIEVNTHIIGGDDAAVKERQIKQADQVTEVMRDIIDFQKAYVTPVIKKLDQEQKGGRVGRRKGTDLGGVSQSPYFQKVFNVINQLLYSIKAKDAAALMIEEFKAGRKPFLAVRSTMEAMLNDMVDRGELSVGDPISADFSFVIRKGLEGVMRITREDAQGNKTYENIPVTELSDAGKLEYKRLLYKITNMKTGLTLSPIDQILTDLRAAGLRVAEITGRKIRVDIKPDGKTYLETNKKLSINEAYRQYNSGDIDVLIVNRSGSTGASAHASEKVKDQRPRTMFVLENELDISELVQILFRVNRSGQVNLPKYVFVSSSIPAEQRLMMMTMRKLKSLDANTTSNQKQSKGLIEVPEIFNKYGDQVVLEYLQDNPEVNIEISDPVKTSQNAAGEVVPEEGAANKVTGKVAVLSAEKQAAFYTDITQRYNKYMEFLDEAGMNDLVIENLPLKAATLKKSVDIVGKGGRSRFGDDTYIEEVEVNVLKKPMTKAEIDHAIKELGGDRTDELKPALADYATKLYEREAKAVNDKYDKKVANIQKDTTITEDVRETEIQALATERQDFLSGKQATAESKIKYIEGLINFFKSGKAVMIPVDYADMRNGGVRPGIFMGFDVDISNSKAFLPSNVTLKFAINDSRRTLTLPASRDNLVNFIRESSYSLSQSFQDNTRNDWDKLKKPKDREKRIIVTGNILQGLGKEAYRKGNIVKYTTDEGYINTGILMPESFDPAEEGVGNTVSVPAKKVSNIVLQMPTGTSLESADETVSITRNDNRFSIRVPLPKQTGGKYYLDEQMNRIVIGGRWDSVGSSMEAFVDPSRVDELMTLLGNKYSTSFNVDKKLAKSLDKPADLMQFKPAGKSISIDEAKGRRGAKKKDVKPFNMADRVKETFKKYGISINEGSLRRAYDGVYKHMTDGVRVQSMWDLFVASHEMTHAMDTKYNLSERIQKQGTQKLQGEFIHAYENLYPKPKKTAALKERIQEGMAMVMEYYVSDPNAASVDYPEIIKHLFQPGGNFHKQEMTDFVEDMSTILADYQALHPEEKINARLKWDGTKKEGGVATKVKVLHALTNDLITANMVDNMVGGELRAKAITPNVTMLRGIAAIAGNWIRKPFGPSEDPQTYIGNGMWANKKSKYRVEDLLTSLGSMDEITKFSDWLIARRQYFDFLKIEQMQEEIDNGNNDQELADRLEQLKEVVDRNKMPIELVEAVYNKFEGKYKKEAEIFDAINRDLIDFMEATELITRARADEYRLSPGYASYQRYIEDEHLANTDALNLSSGSKSKLNQLKARSGSSLQILPPVFSQMVAVNEVLRKGQLNLVWKAWADAAKGNKEVAEMFEIVNKPDIKNTKDFQPVYENGVQKWYKLSEESRMFAQALAPDQVNLLNAFLRGAARSFQAMTTQFFAPFAVMNVTIDASTRFMQSKTGLIPLIHDISTTGKAMAGLAHWMGLIDKSTQNNEFEQYMALGGRKQTLAGTLQLEPQEAIESLLNDNWVQKTKNGFEMAIKVAEVPVNMTELIGRSTEFKRAMAKGYPTNVAMHMAANVGINFSNKGALAVNYLRSVAYMGAGIQAFSQFVKTAKENPGRAAMAVGIMTTLAATGAIATYMWGDDDEKIALANQNPEELAKFIFMPASAFGMKSGLIKIRIPEQGGNVAAATQLYFQHLFMNNKIDFTDIYRSQEAMLPSQLKFSQGLGVLGSYIPQAISPSIQAVTNTRFYPALSPIVPDYMKDLDEYAQYDKYTSRTAKALGELTEGTLMEISPKKVDFLIRAQAGRTVSLVQGLAESAIFGDQVKTYINIFEDADRFLFTGRIYNKFYEMREEAKQEVAAMKKYPSPISFAIAEDSYAKVKLYDEIHERLVDISARMNRSIPVSMEERKQMFSILQSITAEELEFLNKNPEE